MDPKHRSRLITDGRDRAPSRAMFKAIGFTGDDLTKPLIGVANTWIETMPCNFHLRRLSAKVKEGIRAAGGTPMEFNTIAISDGETMGTEGMRASLVSREVIAEGSCSMRWSAWLAATRRFLQRQWHWRASICLDWCYMEAPLLPVIIAVR